MGGSIDKVKTSFSPDDPFYVYSARHRTCYQFSRYLKALLFSNDWTQWLAIYSCFLYCWWDLTLYSHFFIDIAHFFIHSRGFPGRCLICLITQASLTLNTVINDSRVSLVLFCSWNRRFSWLAETVLIFCSQSF